MPGVRGIIKKFDGRCPRCIRKLSFEAKAIRLNPYARADVKPLSRGELDFLN